MLVLDTNDLTALQLNSPVGIALAQRLKSAAIDHKIVTTIVSVEEQLRGWLAELHKHAKDPSRQVYYYKSSKAFSISLQTGPFCHSTFWASNELIHLQSDKRASKVKPMDLKIAAVTLLHDAMLLSANLKDSAGA